MDAKWKERVKGLTVKEQWNILYKDKLKVRQEGQSIWRTGSFKKNSKRLVNSLPGVLEKLEVKSFVDIGCGDFLWMCDLDWTKIKYTGLDIVAGLMEENKIKHPELEFRYFNLIEDIPPKADMLFMRSVFIHTCLNDCLKMIENIKKSGSKYLMASTLSRVDINIESTCLWLKQRNLRIEPFNFPEPLMMIEEMERKDINNYMGAWRIDDLN